MPGHWRSGECACTHMQRWSDETGRQDVARQRGTVRRASANLTGRSGVLCSAIQQQAPDDGRSRAPTDAFRFIAWSGGVHLSTRARGQAGLSTYTGLVVRIRLHRTVSKARPGSPRVYFHYATSTARCSCFPPRDCGDHCVVSERLW
jgi:hypothetical protein